MSCDDWCNWLDWHMEWTIYDVMQEFKKSGLTKQDIATILQQWYIES